jgi:hypothetical protein
MKRVLLATITESDQCSTSFTNSLVQSIRVGLSNQTEILPVFFRSLGNWAMAANQAMTVTWAEKLDGLVLVNPCVGWRPESLIELCQTGKDAVALPVSTQAGFNIKLGEVSRLQEDESTGEIKVQGASLSFFYLSSYALNQLAESHPTVSYHGMEIKLILQSGDIYASYHTHEEVLAYRLRELGIEIWVNSRHTVQLQELIESVGDFAQVLKSLKENG